MTTQPPSHMKGDLRQVQSEFGPAPADMSCVHVRNSHMFGLSNVAGSLLTGAGVASLALVTTGMLKGVGFMAALGIPFSLPIAAGLAVFAFGAGLTGYWAGNRDDRLINKWNEYIDTVQTEKTNRMLDSLEHRFMTALGKAEYDPNKASLPLDALGAAVMLPDSQIMKLPPHVRLDIYRTQSDLALYKAEKLGASNDKLARATDERVLNDRSATIIEKADYFRQRRDAVYKLTTQGRLSRLFGEKSVAVLPPTAPAYEMGKGLSQRDSLHQQSYDSGHSSGYWNGFIIGQSIGRGSSSSAHSATYTNSAAIAAGSSSSSNNNNSSSSSSSPAAGQAAGQAAVLALAAAAYIAVGFAVYRNWMTSAPKPKELTIPVTAKLPSAEGDLRNMYRPGQPS